MELDIPTDLADKFPKISAPRAQDEAECRDCSFFRGKDGELLPIDEAGVAQVPCGAALIKEGPQTVPRLRAILAAGGGGLDCPVSVEVEDLLAKAGDPWVEVVVSPQQVAFLSSHLEGQKSPGYVIGEYEVSEGTAFVFAGLSPTVDPNKGGLVQLVSSERAIFSFKGCEVAKVNCTASTGFHWVNPDFEKASDGWERDKVEIPTTWKKLSMVVPEGFAFSLSFREKLAEHSKSGVSIMSDGTAFIGSHPEADLEYIEKVLWDLVCDGGRYKFEA